MTSQVLEGSQPSQANSLHSWSYLLPIDLAPSPSLLPSCKCSFLSRRAVVLGSAAVLSGAGEVRLGRCWLAGVVLVVWCWAVLGRRVLWR